MLPIQERITIHYWYCLWIISHMFSLNCCMLCCLTVDLPVWFFTCIRIITMWCFHLISSNFILFYFKPRGTLHASYKCFSFKIFSWSVKWLLPWLQMRRVAFTCRQKYKAGVSFERVKDKSCTCFKQNQIYLCLNGIGHVRMFSGSLQETGMGGTHRKTARAASQ